MINGNVYAQIPSMLPIKDKISRINKINELGIQGISISSLPSNDDIFQLLAVIGKEYSLNFGISIISPLFYHLSNLEKSIETLINLLGSEKRLFIAFGVGDKYTLNKFYPNETNFFERFKTKTSQLNLNLKDKGLNLDILIAGSGYKMINFGLESDLAILFNGINVPSSLHDSNGLGVFIMSHFGDLTTIPENHLMILVKMVINTPKNELKRLKIDNQTVNSLKQCLKEKNSVEEIKKIVNSDLINKVSFMGDKNKLEKQLKLFQDYNVRKIVISQSSFNDWSLYN